MSPSEDRTHVNGVFLTISNLSFFCERAHIQDLVDEYFFGVVVVEVVRQERRCSAPDVGWRTTYHFVDIVGMLMVQSNTEAELVTQLLDGHLFQGRKIRIQRFENDFHTQVSTFFDLSDVEQDLVVLLSFTSVNYHPSNVPTETLWMKAFLSYGLVQDVAVHCLNTEPFTAFAEGRAVITFSSLLEVRRVIAARSFYFCGYDCKCSTYQEGFRGASPSSSPSVNDSSGSYPDDTTELV